MPHSRNMLDAQSQQALANEDAILKQGTNPNVPITGSNVSSSFSGLPSVNTPSTIPANTISTATGDQTSLPEFLNQQRSVYGLPALQSERQQILQNINTLQTGGEGLLARLRTNPELSVSQLTGRQGAVQTNLANQVNPFLRQLGLTEQQIQDVNNQIEQNANAFQGERTFQQQQKQFTAQQATAKTNQEIEIIRALSDIPEGQTVTINGQTFKGTKKVNADVQLIEKNDGSIIAVNKGTNAVTLVSGPVNKPDFQPVTLTSRDVFGNESQSVVTFDKTTGKILGGSSLSASPGNAVQVQAPKALNDAFSQVASEISNKIGLASFSKAYQGYINQGDSQKALELIVNQAAKNTGPTLYQQYLGRVSTIKNLTDIRDQLKEFVKSGGSLNLLSGTYEQVLQKLGTVSNPTLRKIATRIQQTLFDYRRAFTGAQFSAQEAEQYQSVFPTIKGNIELNESKIQGLLDGYYANQQAFLSSILGSSNYEALVSTNFNNPEIKSTSSNLPILKRGENGITYYDVKTPQDIQSVPRLGRILINGTLYRKMSDNPQDPNYLSQINL